jgi:hypothetical protein
VFSYRSEKARDTDGDQRMSFQEAVNVPEKADSCLVLTHLDSYRIKDSNK